MTIVAARGSVGGIFAVKESSTVSEFFLCCGESKEGVESLGRVVVEEEEVYEAGVYGCPSSNKRKDSAV